METGLSLTLLDTQKTGFLASKPSQQLQNVFSHPLARQTTAASIKKTMVVPNHEDFSPQVLK